MAHKELVYIKGFAKGRQYWNLLKAINIAESFHAGQPRKDGSEYIEHPMRVTSALIALGMHDENVLTASILHDVVEDCNITYSQLINDYNIPIEIVEIVNLVTKIKDLPLQLYYERMKRDRRAILIKISDRCHNVSTMAGAFNIEKMKEYVEETEIFILPLCKYAKNYFPEHSDQIFVMKYHIESICNTIKEFINILEVKRGE